jgi:hypothetical protein
VVFLLSKNIILAGGKNMKAIGKILESVLIAIIVVLVILVAAFFLLGDYLIKVGVEKGGSAALGVPVKVGGVHLSVLRGLVTIDGLQVANPPGYKNEYLLEVGSGRVSVSIPSLLKDTIHVKEITLDGTKLAIEQKGLSSNIKDLLNAMPKGKPEEPKKPGEEPKKPGKKLVVDKLEITNTEAKLAVMVGEGAGVNLKLAPIKMENLGADSPLSVAELTSKIFVALIQGVAQQGAGLLPDDVVSGMKGGLDKVTELGTESGKKVIEEGTKVIEGIKGLFKPKKE